MKLNEDYWNGLVHGGAIVGFGCMASVAVVSWERRRQTLKVINDYTNKWKALGPVIELFSQLGEWMESVAPETPEEKDKFIDDFLEKAQFLGIACTSLQEDYLDARSNNNEEA